MKLSTILSEMAMRPTLEKEFTTIVNKFKSDYRKSIKEYIIRQIHRVDKDIKAYNGKDAFREFWADGYGKYSSKKFGLYQLFCGRIFIANEFAHSKNPKWPEPEFRKIHGYWSRPDIDTISDEERNRLRDEYAILRRRYVLIPESAWMPIVDNYVDIAVGVFYDAFIAKNTAKFSGVIKNKPISKIDHNIGRNLTGNLFVKCEDGSKFRASFSIEMSVSVNGKVFNRFPTRFHDVIMVDGTSMKAPSEAKMKKDF